MYYGVNCPLIWSERVKNFEQNSENLIKIGWKLRKLYCIVLYLFITKLFKDYKVWPWTNDIDHEHLIIGANK